MTLMQQKGVLDMMEVMAGHTEENGLAPVSRYSRPVMKPSITAKQAQDIFDEVERMAVREMDRLTKENTGMEFSMNMGVHDMDDGSSLIWYIISRRIKD